MLQDFRKWILIGYGLAIIIAVVYVPWTHTVYIPFSGTEIPFSERDYAFIFFSPYRGGGAIDFRAVLLEIIAITAAAGVAYLIWVFGKQDKP